MVHPVTVCQHPLGYLLQGLALIPQVGGFVHQQAVARGGAQGVDDLNLALRILLPQHIRRDVGVIHRAGLTGGEGDVQQVALLQLLLKELGISGHIDLRGLGQLSLLQKSIELR